MKSRVNWGRIVDVEVCLISIDSWVIVVWTNYNCWLLNWNSCWWSLVSVVSAGVACEWTSSVIVLIRNLLYFFSHKVVSGVTNTWIGVPVVRRVRRTSDANSTDSHISDFAETAVFEEIFMSSTAWRNEGVTFLSCCVVDFIHSALNTLRSCYCSCDVCCLVGSWCCCGDFKVSLGANACLFISVIYLVVSTNY